MFGTGRALDFVSKCMALCAATENAGHVGKPGPFGSPVFAKFTQQLLIPISTAVSLKRFA